jgi:hypothetical protein
MNYIISYIDKLMMILNRYSEHLPVECTSIHKIHENLYSSRTDADFGGHESVLSYAIDNTVIKLILDNCNNLNQLTIKDCYNPTTYVYIIVEKNI